MPSNLQLTQLINRIECYVENPSSKEAEQALRYLDELHEIVVKSPQPVLTRFYYHLEKKLRPKQTESAPSR